MNQTNGTITNQTITNSTIKIVIETVKVTPRYRAWYDSLHPLDKVTIPIVASIVGLVIIYKLYQFFRNYTIGGSNLKGL